MPIILAAYESRDLLIFLNHQLGPRQDQEPKGYEPCDYSSTAPQRLSSRPQLLSLPLVLANPSNLSSGPCHNTSSAHAKPTPGPCHPTCRTTPTVAPRQPYPRRRQEKLIFLTSVQHEKDEEINERRSFARARCRRLLEEGEQISSKLSLSCSVE